jgi:hypothetical protein
VPEVDRGRDQQIPPDDELRRAVVCSLSSAEVSAWSGRSSTWRCVAASSWSCSASGLPTSFLRFPDLSIHQVWNGYWHWGRPTNEELRQGLRAVTRAIRPDWEVPAR